jgi:hypothetical protein
LQLLKTAASAATVVEQPLQLEQKQQEQLGVRKYCLAVALQQQM